LGDPSSVDLDALSLHDALPIYATPASSSSALRIVWVYPDLLSTYGDRGNLLVLGYRARKRGMPVELIEVRSTEALPTTADIYLRSEEHTSNSSHVKNSYAVFCL